MPANKYALLRYRIIDRLINNPYDPYPTKENLREACEEELYGSGSGRISISTIEKDLNAMRFEKNLGYYAPIAYSKEEKGYYYEEKDYSIEHISLNEEDLETIKYAAAVLKQFKSLSVFDSFEGTIDKVLDRVDVSLSDQRANIEEFVKFDAPITSSGSQWFRAIVESILSHFKVRILYTSSYGDEEKTYELEPYWLKEWQDTWYLIAYSEERGKLLTFGLDRIERLEVLDTIYKVRKDIDLPTYFHHALGITSGDDQKPARVILKVQEPDARYIINKAWHATQQVEQREDYALITLDVLVTYELISKILSYGGAIEVLGPDKLIRQITDQLKKMKHNYKLK